MEDHAEDEDQRDPPSARDSPGRPLSDDCGEDNGEDNGEPIPQRPRLDQGSFSFLGHGANKRRSVREIMFWNRASLEMTIWDAIYGKRSVELKVLLEDHPEWLEMPRLGSDLTPLQVAVLNDSYECACVLIEAGAKGIIDILEKTESAFRFRLMPHVLPLCSRQELRDMEQRRLVEKLPAIGGILLRGICQTKWYRQVTPGVVKTGAEEEAEFTGLFMDWIRWSGADDFRDHLGQSLQLQCAELRLWDILYLLQKRALLTFLAVHRFSWNVNPELCRIHRDVILHHIVPYVYRPAYCHRCKRGVKENLVCGGCRAVPVPCQPCRDGQSALHRFPLCAKCHEPACVDCVRFCTGNPRLSVCRTVFCSRCGPKTCDACAFADLHRLYTSSSSSSEEEEEEESSSVSSSSSDLDHLFIDVMDREE